MLPSWLALLGPLLLGAGAAPGAGGEGPWVLPAGSEEVILRLVAPYSLGVPLPGGFLH